LAQSKGRKLEAGWGTLKFLQEILIASGHDEADAKQIMMPLQLLHGLRTTLKGHASVQTRKAAEIEARTQHGTFRKQFMALVTDCDKSLVHVLTVLGENPS